MMEKILIRLFIIIALLGLLNTTVKVNAEDPAGLCILIENNKDVSYINITEKACRLLVSNQPALRKFKSWTQNSSTTPPGPTTQVNNTNYELLEQLPGLEKEVDVSGDDAFGNYLNVMIGLFIGICAVLAVVMIVIGGIEYATSELVSSKEAGIEKMKGAVLGLLLALGAVVILKEINPAFLDTTLSIRPVVVNVLVEEFEISSGQEDGPLQPSDSRGLNACTEGLVQTQNGKKMCKTIAEDFDRMMDAAKNAGAEIVASGFRSRETQQAIRDRFRCPDATTVNCPGGTVAPVGSSRHENGLAFDVLRCNKKAPTCSDSCFNWMRNNGGRFGFYNKIYPQTNDCVHWSVDGK